MELQLEFWRAEVHCKILTKSTCSIPFVNLVQQWRLSEISCQLWEKPYILLSQERLVTIIFTALLLDFILLNGFSGPVFIEFPLDVLYPYELVKRELFNIPESKKLKGKIINWYWHQCFCNKYQMNYLLGTWITTWAIYLRELGSRPTRPQFKLMQQPQTAPRV